MTPDDEPFEPKSMPKYYRQVPEDRECIFAKKITAIEFREDGSAKLAFASPGFTTLITPKHFKDLLDLHGGSAENTGYFVYFENGDVGWMADAVLRSQYISEEQVKTEIAEGESLETFKKFVHKRLDLIGVPAITCAAEAGDRCSVSCRLNWLQALMRNPEKQALCQKYPHWNDYHGGGSVLHSTTPKEARVSELTSHKLLGQNYVDALSVLNLGGSVIVLNGQLRAIKFN